jgi:hypothetical protein
MEKVHVLKETPKLDKFFNVTHPKLMGDHDLIDPKVVMESLPDIVIILLRQFKDQWHQITWAKSAKPRRDPKLCISPFPILTKWRSQKSAGPLYCRDYQDRSKI